MKHLTIFFVSLGLMGCNDFMNPDNMAEGIEAEERCNNWQEETRKETTRFGMEYTLFNRACKLNEEKTMILGYEGQYETGNSQKDKQIRASWKVVTTFALTPSWKFCAHGVLSLWIDRQSDSRAYIRLENRGSGTR